MPENTRLNDVPWLPLRLSGHNADLNRKMTSRDTTNWMTDEKCPSCGGPVACNSRYKWCVTDSKLPEGGKRCNV